MRPWEGYMKLLGVAAFAVAFWCAGALFAYAQASQQTQDENSSARPAPAPGASAPFTLAPAKPPRFQFVVPKGSGPFRFLGQPLSRSQTPPQGSFDRGIYARNLAGAGDEMCGSIVSYNFSEGENPRLESVTTCTSSSTIKALRTRGKNRKPVIPQFRTTALQSPSQP
jgi:hypothetical protein